jgi:hypothetical protein
MRWKIILGTLLTLSSLTVLLGVDRLVPTGPTTAVSIPISLSPVHTTVEFTTGYRAHYRVAIEFDEPNNIQYDPRDCVTAEYFPPGECDGIPARFTGTWTLTSGGQLVKFGTVPPTMWRLSHPFSSRLCLLDAQRSATYKLDVKILTDGSSLASAKPRLAVYVSEPEFFDTFDLWKSLKLFIKFASGFCMVIGLLIIAFSFRPDPVPS